LPTTDPSLNMPYHRSRILELRATSKEGAFEEMVAAVCAGHAEIDPKAIRAELSQKEALFSSVVRDGVAIPHVRIAMEPPVLVAIGRSEEGVKFFDNSFPRVRLVILLLSREDLPESHLRILAQIAKILNNNSMLDRIFAATSADEILAIFSPKGARRMAAKTLDQEITKLLIEESARLAKKLKVSAVLVNCDQLQDIELLAPLKETRLIPVFKEQIAPDAFLKRFPEVLAVPDLDLAKVGQIRLTIFLALARNWLRKKDVVLYLLPGVGVRGLSNLDVVVIRDRFKEVVHFQTERFRKVVQPAVLERVIKIAFDLAVSGREGKRIGTLFVLGDQEIVLKSSQQLVVNPFRRDAFSDETWNIQDPAVEEMVKELSQLDGAFVIAGDGAIRSAATYIGSKRKRAEIPKGFGARHQAAANITAATKALAVVLSESSGTVTIFQNGKILLSVEQIPRGIRIQEGE